MNIHRNCIIDLLSEHGVNPTYIDVHKIGSVTYFFDKISLKFTNSCLPFEVAQAYLEIFALQNFIDQIAVIDCSCDW